MKKLLIMGFLLTSWASFAQVHGILEPEMSTRPVTVDNINTAQAEWHCFGGRPFLEKYLDLRFAPLLEKGLINTMPMELVIKIDTLGFTKSIDFKSKDNLCLECNEILLKAVQDIRRWKPAFSYDIDHWRDSCPYTFEEKDITLSVRIIKSNIYVNNKRDRKIVFKPHE